MPLSLRICRLVLWPLPALSPSGEPGPVGFRRHLHGITETMALTRGLG